MFMDLPKNEKSFSFEAVGEDTGKKYEGEFTVICIPNMFQKRAIEIEKTRLQADQTNPTMNLMGLGEVLANCRVRIIEGPSWWKDSNGGFDIMDENVCVKLYDQVMAQEMLWKDEVKKRSKAKDPKLGEKSTGSK